MINSKLSDISSSIANSYYYKTSYKCEEDLPLILLSKANLSCLDKYELKTYNDRLSSLLFDCKDVKKEVTVNNSNRENWEVNNPSCVSRKQWEKIALKICEKYKIEVIFENITDDCEIEIDMSKTTIEKDCEVDFDVLKKNMDKACDIAFDITKKIIDCEVLTAISIQQKMCELKVKVDMNKDKCHAEYKLLIEKYPDCNITKREYITLLDNNFSFEVISSIYSKKLKLEVDSNGHTYLVSPVNTYSLKNDLKFKEIVVDSQTRNITLPERIMNDYKLTNIKKQQLLNEIYFV